MVQGRDELYITSAPVIADGVNLTAVDLKVSLLYVCRSLRAPLNARLQQSWGSCYPPQAEFKRRMGVRKVCCGMHVTNSAYEGRRRCQESAISTLHGLCYLNAVHISCSMHMPTVRSKNEHYLIPTIEEMHHNKLERVTQMFLNLLEDTAGLAKQPPRVAALLDSRACRSAIMFGDELLPERCFTLMRQLAVSIEISDRETANINK